MGLQTLKDPETRIPKDKYPAIHRSVLAACDGLDGLKDGLITDPTSCHFDPQVMACKQGDGLDCLTPKQVQSVKTILGPAKSPTTGAEIFPGYQPGTELAWGLLIGGPDPYETALDQFPLHGVQRSEMGLADLSMSIVTWQRPIRSCMAS
jgi:feruloyl esterase